jgi:type 1 fimbria pilin
MTKHETWRDGVLIQQWDDTNREFTTWDAEGNPTSRPYTVEENAQADIRALRQAESTNETSLRDKLRLALTANNDYLAISSPTAAQTTAQVKLLSRQANALIRLANQQLDSDAGT